MELEMINKMIKELNLNELFELESIPNLDLYMDQVITLFEDKLAYTKRKKSDKLLTKTMINNYAKDKLLMPAVKKKYTREHVILMVLLYEMKQILTIGDIKILFETIIKEDQVDSELLITVYEIYLMMKANSGEIFEEQVDEIEQVLSKQIKSKPILNQHTDCEKLKDMLLVVLLTQKANYYKRLAEKIIDERLTNKQDAKKK